MTKLLFLRVCFLLPFIIAVSSFCFSQNDTIKKPEHILQDKHFYAFSPNYAKEKYKNEMFNNCGYINGREYKRYYSGNSNPYFRSTRGTGTIYSKGNAYSKLVLFYDIFMNKLVCIPHLPQFVQYYIEINKTTVDSFAITLNNETYLLKNIHFPRGTNILMEDGFYEVPYQSKMQFLIQHKCRKTKRNGKVDYVYMPEKFICMKGQYYRINTRNKLFKLFPDKRKAIRKKINAPIIHFRALTKKEIVEILQFVESL